MFQAWASIKVTNEESTYFGRAGTVLRTERQGDTAQIVVTLDADAVNDSAVVNFEASELVQL